jgi:Protein of unknown function (DUF2867)
MSKIIEIATPERSAILGALKRVDFTDSYEANVSRPTIDAQGAYVAIFGPRPRWIAVLMKMRGLFARVIGLKHPAPSEVNEVDEIDASAAGRPYAVGERAGIFPVQSVQANELILGLDDKHLNFRVSVLRYLNSGTEKVAVTTVVEINNGLGRAYLFVIKPFHKLIVRSILQNAIDAGRI